MRCVNEGLKIGELKPASLNGIKSDYEFGMKAPHLEEKVAVVASYITNYLVGKLSQERFDATPLFK